VLAGLQERMLDPELVSVFVREYHQEYSRRSADRTKRRSRIAKRHDEAIAKVNRLVEAIANGADEFVEIKAVLASARESATGLKLSCARSTRCQSCPPSRHRRGLSAAGA
jgi:hypothetical protein